MSAKWTSYLTDIEREEILTFRNFRERSLTEIGKAHLEVMRARATVLLAEENLRVAEAAVTDIDRRITMRINDVLSGKDVDDFVIDINDIQ